MASERPPFAVDPGAMDVLGILWREGHGAYLVGGGVRDALLEREVSDWDVATDARPDRIMAIFPGSSYQNRFGTVLARGMEITTFRRDHHYADHRRPDRVVFSDDIYEDLARRDLTINAIAWGRSRPEADARVVDPADGRGDLDARLVRAVGDPGRRFEEDALRLLRAVRIAARLEFDIEPVTWQAMLAHAADMQFVSEERSGREVRLMLGAPAPSRAFRLLHASGILVGIAPELDALVSGSLDLDGIEDAGTVLAVLDRVVAEHPGHEQLALAALLAPLGPRSASRVLERLRLAGRHRDALVELITAAAIDYRPEWSDADVRRYMTGIRPGLLDVLLALRRVRVADDEAGALEAELAQRIGTQRDAAAPLTLAELAVDGRDLRDALGVPESPAMGMILERLLADVIEEPLLNTRSSLLTRAQMVYDELLQEGLDGAGDAAIR